MLEHNTQKTPPIEKSFAVYFKHDAIIAHLACMIPIFSLLDIAHLEEALGKSRLRYVDTLYELLNKRYFPHIPKAPKTSSKEHFQSTVSTLLNMLNKTLQVSLSPYLFFEAATGRVKALLHRKPPFTLDQTFWLHQIQYAYHLNIKNVKNPTAYFSSDIKVMQLLLTSFSWEAIFAQDIEHALYCAVHLNQFNLVSILLQSPPQKIPTKTIGLALCHATQNRNFTLACLLLEQGPISAKDKGLALYYAAKDQYFALVKQLLEHPGQEAIFIKDIKEALSHVLTLKTTPAPLVNLLLSHLGKETISAKDKGLALCIAVQNENISLAKVLLTHPIPHTMSAEDKKEALRYALQIESTNSLQLLLEHLHEVSISTKDKGLALGQASKKGNATLVQLLLEHRQGEEISTQDKELALAYATEERHTNIVKMLFHSLVTQVTLKRTASSRLC